MMIAKTGPALSIVILLIVMTAKLYADSEHKDRGSKLVTMGNQHKFLSLDHDQNGYISKLEALVEQPLSDTYRNFDTNEDDRISIKEFRSYFNLRYGAIANAHSMHAKQTFIDHEEAFYWLDTDKNGVVSISEFSGIDLNACKENSSIDK